MSVTVTVKLACVELPAASRAVYVTVVVPRSKVEPEATEGVSEVTPQLSVAVGLTQITAAVHTPSAVFTLMLSGMSAMAGAWLSVTVTTCVAVASLPEGSITVQVTVV